MVEFIGHERRRTISHHPDSSCPSSVDPSSARGSDFVPVPSKTWVSQKVDAMSLVFGRAWVRRALRFPESGEYVSAPE